MAGSGSVLPPIAAMGAQTGASGRTSKLSTNASQTQQQQQALALAAQQKKRKKYRVVGDKGAGTGEANASKQGYGGMNKTGGGGAVAESKYSGLGSTLQVPIRYIRLTRPFDTYRILWLAGWLLY